MSYSKQTWSDTTTSGTAITADKLNHIEDGIYNAHLRYDVGDIYITTNEGNPATKFPGTTWEQITDRFLLAAGTTYKNGDTGGEATHKLTLSEIPAHSHTANSLGIDSGSLNSNQSMAWLALRDVGLKKHVSNTGKTNNAGSSAAHNNMPPYRVVYMWIRIS